MRVVVVGTVSEEEDTPDIMLGELSTEPSFEWCLSTGGTANR
jgi:hypothetical protein